jgi:hypothetical protein
LTLAKTVVFSAKALESLASKDYGGDVERVVLSEETLDIYNQFMEELQPTVHGLSLFDQ